MLKNNFIYKEYMLSENMLDRSQQNLEIIACQHK